MNDTMLKAICDAIKTGARNQEQLSPREFEAIHNAVAIAQRKWAIDLVANAKLEFKQQVESLAERIT